MTRRSMHDIRNKTQTCFKGWDYAEIIEWMDEEDKLNHKTRWSKLKFRLNTFKREITRAFSHLFGTWYLHHDDQYDIKQTKKAIEHLADQCWQVNSNQSDEVSMKYRKKIGGLRTYVEKLSENNHTTVAPLWVGLSNIKDDETFLIYTSMFLDNLWD